VKLCKNSEPDFDACLINSVETLRPRLNKGKCTVIANCPSQADGLLPLYPIQSQKTPVHILPACLFMIPSNIILPRRPRPSKRSVSFRHPDQYVYFNAQLISAICVTCPPNLIPLDLIILMIAGNQEKPWSSSLQIFFIPLPVPPSWLSTPHPAVRHPQSVSLS